MTKRKKTDIKKFTVEIYRTEPKCQGDSTHNFSWLCCERIRGARLKMANCQMCIECHPVCHLI